MNLHTRGTIAALAIAGAALIAAGCGGSGDSGSSGAAKDAAALDLVPKTALGYVTFDTDFSGDQWTQFNDLATAFDKDFKGVDDVIADEASSDSDDDSKEADVDFSKDVDPWLGTSAGVALLNAKQNDDGDLTGLMAWVELEDTAKFEDFLKDRDFKSGDKVGDFETYSKADDDSYIGFNDDFAVLTMTKAQLAKTLKFDGDSIKDAAGVSDTIDEVESDSLATLVMSGAGLRAAAKDDESFKSFADVKQLKDLHAMALSFSAEEDGLRLDGHIHADGEEAGKNEENELFGDVPANTVLAIGGNDLGGGLKTLAESAGKESKDVQEGIGAFSGILGVDLDDFAKAFDGEFVLGLSADEAGLGALAGGAASAAMGGGASSLDPASLLKAGSLFLAFEETGEASATLDKVAGAIGGLAGGGAAAAPKTSSAGDFTTKQLAIQGIPVTTAASDDVAAVAVGADVFSNWGGDSLGDNDGYTAAWKAADAPDKTLAQMWFDAGRVANLAGVEGGDDVKLGGMVGWIEADGSNGDFGVFLHVNEG